MAKTARKGSTGSRGTGGKGRSTMREGGWRISVPNSGLEVWLYDDAHREAIRRAGSDDAGFGGMPPQFSERTQQGLIVGYSLAQDDDLDLEIHVGETLTEDELSVARWLEPQTAFLWLPSGTLCIESNDASRLGPETPTETGARLDLPRGDYRVTLYRIDDEGLSRDGMKWTGPREVIVLTLGGSVENAAEDLLPYEKRRDLGWVGEYTIRGNRAEALVWFFDYWDTFLVNLDSAAAAKLSLAPGAYLRTHVPAVGITTISAFAESWDDALRLPPPAGVDLDEYGVAALQPIGDWDGAEGMLCHREKTRDRVEDKYQHAWHPATIEVLDAQPLDDTRAFAKSDLRTATYFEPDFLSLVLSDVLLEIGDRNEFPLPDAVDALDATLAKMGLVPQGDMTWQERIRSAYVEVTCRLYTGLPNTFAAILAREGAFEVLFLSELGDGGWIVTGFADEIGMFVTTTAPDGTQVPNPRVQFANIEEPLPKIAAAHKAALRKPKAPLAPAPGDLEAAVAALDRFLTVVFR